MDVPFSPNAVDSPCSQSLKPILDQLCANLDQEALGTEDEFTSNTKSNLRTTTPVHHAPTTFINEGTCKSSNNSSGNLETHKHSSLLLLGLQIDPHTNFQESKGEQKTQLTSLSNEYSNDQQNVENTYSNPQHFRPVSLNPYSQTNIQLHLQKNAHTNSQTNINSQKENGFMKHPNIHQHKPVINETCPNETLNSKINPYGYTNPTINADLDLNMLSKFLVDTCSDMNENAEIDMLSNSPFNINQFSNSDIDTLNSQINLLLNSYSKVPLDSDMYSNSHTLNKEHVNTAPSMDGRSCSEGNTMHIQPHAEISEEILSPEENTNFSTNVNSLFNKNSNFPTSGDKIFPICTTTETNTKGTKISESLNTNPDFCPNKRIVSGMVEPSYSRESAHSSHADNTSIKKHPISNYINTTDIKLPNTTMNPQSDLDLKTTNSLPSFSHLVKNVNFKSGIRFNYQDPKLAESECIKSLNTTKGTYTDIPSESFANSPELLKKNPSKNQSNANSNYRVHGFSDNQTDSATFINPKNFLNVYLNPQSEVLENTNPIWSNIQPMGYTNAKDETVTNILPDFNTISSRGSSLSNTNTTPFLNLQRNLDSLSKTNQNSPLNTYPLYQPACSVSQVGGELNAPPLLVTNPQKNEISEILSGDKIHFETSQYPDVVDQNLQTNTNINFSSDVYTSLLCDLTSKVRETPLSSSTGINPNENIYLDKQLNSPDESHLDSNTNFEDFSFQPNLSASLPHPENNSTRVTNVQEYTQEEELQATLDKLKIQCEILKDSFLPEGTVGQVPSTDIGSQTLIDNQLITQTMQDDNYCSNISEGTRNFCFDFKKYFPEATSNGAESGHKTSDFIEQTNTNQEQHAFSYAHTDPNINLGISALSIETEEPRYTNQGLFSNPFSLESKTSSISSQVDSKNEALNSSVGLNLHKISSTGSDENWDSEFQVKNINSNISENSLTNSDPGKNSCLNIGTNTKMKRIPNLIPISLANLENNDSSDSWSKINSNFLSGSQSDISVACTSNLYSVKNSDSQDIRSSKISSDPNSSFQYSQKSFQSSCPNNIAPLTQSYKQNFDENSTLGSESDSIKIFESKQSDSLNAKIIPNRNEKEARNFHGKSHRAVPVSDEGSNVINSQVTSSIFRSPNLVLSIDSSTKLNSEISSDSNPMISEVKKVNTTKTLPSEIPLDQNSNSTKVTLHVDFPLGTTLNISSTRNEAQKGSKTDVSLYPPSANNRNEDQYTRTNSHYQSISEINFVKSKAQKFSHPAVPIYSNFSKNSQKFSPFILSNFKSNENEDTSEVSPLVVPLECELNTHKEQTGNFHEFSRSGIDQSWNSDTSLGATVEKLPVVSTVFNEQYAKNHHYITDHGGSTYADTGQEILASIANSNPNTCSKNVLIGNSADKIFSGAITVSHLDLSPVIKLNEIKRSENMQLLDRKTERNIASITGEIRCSEPTTIRNSVIYSNTEIQPSIVNNELFCSSAIEQSGSNSKNNDMDDPQKTVGSNIQINHSLRSDNSSAESPMGTDISEFQLHDRNTIIENAKTTDLLLTEGKNNTSDYATSKCSVIRRSVFSKVISNPTHQEVQHFSHNVGKSSKASILENNRTDIRSPSADIEIMEKNGNRELSLFKTLIADKGSSKSTSFEKDQSPKARTEKDNHPDSERNRCSVIKIFNEFSTNQNTPIDHQVSNQQGKYNSDLRFLRPDSKIVLPPESQPNTSNQYMPLNSEETHLSKTNSVLHSYPFLVSKLYSNENSRSNLTSRIEDTCDNGSNDCLPQPAKTSTLCSSELHNNLNHFRDRNSGDARHLMKIPERKLTLTPQTKVFSWSFVTEEDKLETSESTQNEQYNSTKTPLNTSLNCQPSRCSVIQSHLVEDIIPAAGTSTIAENQENFDSQINESSQECDESSNIEIKDIKIKSEKSKLKEEIEKKIRLRLSTPTITENQENFDSQINESSQECDESSNIEIKDIKIKSEIKSEKSKLKEEIEKKIRLRLSTPQKHFPMLDIKPDLKTFPKFAQENIIKITDDTEIQTQIKSNSENEKPLISVTSDTIPNKNLERNSSHQPIIEVDLTSSDDENIEVLEIPQSGLAWRNVIRPNTKSDVCIIKEYHYFYVKKAEDEVKDCKCFNVPVKVPPKTPLKIPLNAPLMFPLKAPLTVPPKLPLPLNWVKKDEKGLKEDPEHKEDSQNVNHQNAQDKHVNPCIDIDSKTDTDDISPESIVSTGGDSFLSFPSTYSNTGTDDKSVPPNYKGDCCLKSKPNEPPESKIKLTTENIIDLTKDSDSLCNIDVRDMSSNSKIRSHQELKNVVDLTQDFEMNSGPVDTSLRNTDAHGSDTNVKMSADYRPNVTIENVDLTQDFDSSMTIKGESCSLNNTSVNCFDIESNNMNLVNDKYFTGIRSDLNTKNTSEPLILGEKVCGDEITFKNVEGFPEQQTKIKAGSIFSPDPNAEVDMIVCSLNTNGNYLDAECDTAAESRLENSNISDSNLDTFTSGTNDNLTNINGHSMYTEYRTSQECWLNSTSYNVNFNLNSDPNTDWGTRICLPQSKGDDLSNAQANTPPMYPSKNMKKGNLETTLRIFENNLNPCNHPVSNTNVEHSSPLSSKNNGDGSKYCELNTVLMDGIGLGCTGYPPSKIPLSYDTLEHQGNTENYVTTHKNNESRLNFNVENFSQANQLLLTSRKRFNTMDMIANNDALLESQLELSKEGMNDLNLDFSSNTDSVDNLLNSYKGKSHSSNVEPNVHLEPQSPLTSSPVTENAAGFISYPNSNIGAADKLLTSLNAGSNYLGTGYSPTLESELDLAHHYIADFNLDFDLNIDATNELLISHNKDGQDSESNTVQESQLGLLSTKNVKDLILDFDSSDKLLIPTGRNDLPLNTEANNFLESGLELVTENATGYNVDGNWSTDLLPPSNIESSYDVDAITLDVGKKIDFGVDESSKEVPSSLTHDSEIQSNVNPECENNFNIESNLIFPTDADTLYSGTDYTLYPKFNPKRYPDSHVTSNYFDNSELNPVETSLLNVEAGSQEKAADMNTETGSNSISNKSSLLTEYNSPLSAFSDFSSESYFDNCPKYGFRNKHIENNKTPDDTIPSVQPNPYWSSEYDKSPYDGFNSISDSMINIFNDELSTICLTPAPNPSLDSALYSNSDSHEKNCSDHNLDLYPDSNSSYVDLDHQHGKSVPRKTNKNDSVASGNMKNFEEQEIGSNHSISQDIQSKNNSVSIVPQTDSELITNKDKKINENSDLNLNINQHSDAPGLEKAGCTSGGYVASDTSSSTSQQTASKNLPVKLTLADLCAEIGLDDYSSDTEENVSSEPKQVTLADFQITIHPDFNQNTPGSSHSNNLNTRGTSSKIQENPQNRTMTSVKPQNTARNVLIAPKPMLCNVQIVKTTPGAEGQSKIQNRSGQSHQPRSVRLPEQKNALESTRTVLQSSSVVNCEKIEKPSPTVVQVIQCRSAPAPETKVGKVPLENNHQSDNSANDKAHILPLNSSLKSSSEVPKRKRASPFDGLFKKPKPGPEERNLSVIREIALRHWQTTQTRKLRGAATIRELTKRWEQKYKRKVEDITNNEPLFKKPKISNNEKKGTQWNIMEQLVEQQKQQTHLQEKTTEILKQLADQQKQQTELQNKHTELLQNRGCCNLSNHQARLETTETNEEEQPQLAQLTTPSSPVDVVSQPAAPTVNILSQPSNHISKLPVTESEDKTNIKVGDSSKHPTCSLSKSSDNNVLKSPISTVTVLPAMGNPQSPASTFIRLPIKSAISPIPKQQGHVISRYPIILVPRSPNPGVTLLAPAGRSSQSPVTTIPKSPVSYAINSPFTVHSASNLPRFTIIGKAKSPIPIMPQSPSYSSLQITAMKTVDSSTKKQTGLGSYRIPRIRPSSPQVSTSPPSAAVEILYSSPLARVLQPTTSKGPPPLTTNALQVKFIKTDVPAKPDQKGSEKTASPQLLSSPKTVPAKSLGATIIMDNHISKRNKNPVSLTTPRTESEQEIEATLEKYIQAMKKDRAVTDDFNILSL